MYALTQTRVLPDRFRVCDELLNVIMFFSARLFIQSLYLSIFWFSHDAHSLSILFTLFYTLHMQHVEPQLYPLLICESFIEINGSLNWILFPSYETIYVRISYMWSMNV